MGNIIGRRYVEIVESESVESESIKGESVEKVYQHVYSLSEKKEINLKGRWQLLGNPPNNAHCTDKSSPSENHQRYLPTEDYYGIAFSQNLVGWLVTFFTSSTAYAHNRLLYVSLLNTHAYTCKIAETAFPQFFDEFWKIIMVREAIL